MSLRSAIVTETDRLCLRAFEQADFERLYAMFNDPLVMRYYVGLKDRDATQGWLERAWRSYEEHGYGLWAVERKDTEEFLGQCGLTAVSIDGRSEIEVGYMFQSDCWGHGYATEAAAACRDLAFTAFGAESVISLIRPENLASRRVAQRLGFEIERETTYVGLRHLVYRGGNRAGPV